MKKNKTLKKVLIFSFSFLLISTLTMNGKDELKANANYEKNQTKVVNIDTSYSSKLNYKYNSEEYLTTTVGNFDSYNKDAAVTINGSYFNMSGGTNEISGLLVNNGQVVHENSRFPFYIGATTNEELKIEKYDTNKKININGRDFEFQAINASTISESEISLNFYNSNITNKYFIDDKKNEDHLILEMNTGAENLKTLNGAINYSVIENKKSGTYSLSENQIAIALNKNSTDLYNELINNTTLNINTNFEFFNNFNWAISSDTLLINENEIINPNFSIPRFQGSPARSAIGIRNDGTIGVYMQESNLGTITDFSYTLLEDNVKTAINLDGGGSSKLFYKGNLIGDSGENRSVTNAISFFINNSSIENENPVSSEENNEENINQEIIGSSETKKEEEEKIEKKKSSCDIVIQDKNELNNIKSTKKNIIEKIGELFNNKESYNNTQIVCDSDFNQLTLR